MSLDIAQIDKLSFTQFFSKEGVALQLTKLKTISGESNFKGFIQVTPEEALLVAQELIKWATPLVDERKKSNHWVERKV